MVQILLFEECKLKIIFDRQVLGVIWFTLSKNVAHNVANEKSTIGLMRVLSDMYEKSFATNKVFLMK